MVRHAKPCQANPSEAPTSETQQVNPTVAIAACPRQHGRLRLALRLGELGAHGLILTLDCLGRLLALRLAIVAVALLLLLLLKDLGR